MTYLLLIPYIAVAYFVAAYFVRRRKTAVGKVVIGILLILIMYLPLGWDVLLGRAYFHYLCTSQGGVHVYQTVKLGPEYWHEDGDPKFINKRGGFDEDILGGRYKFERYSDRKYSEITNIGKYSHKIINRGGGKLLAEKIYYIYYGGWFINHTGFHVSGVACHDYAHGLYSDFLKEVFVKENNLGVGNANNK